MLKHHPEHEVRHYWDTPHVRLVHGGRPGLQQIDEIGIDKVMWSSDYPHNESTFGYSERSLAAVVDALGPEDAVRVVGGNIRTSWASSMAGPLTARGAVMDIPDEPDWARMRSEIGARLRSAMAEHGVDALVLSMNGYVVYATGASWPLLDAGLSHVERPVAVVAGRRRAPASVHAVRSGASSESPVPDDHLHGPVYLEFDHGVEQFARELAGLLPPGAAVAVDELTGAMRRASAHAVPSGPPSDAAIVVGAAQLVKTRDEISCLRRASRITEQAMVDVQKALAPGVRQTDLSAALVRRAFELGATTNMLDAIWQVMPSSREAGVWTTHGDLALPLLTHRSRTLPRETCCGRT